MKTLTLRVALLAAALALCAAPTRAAEPDWPDQLRIGTASPGGTYYVYGEALAKILTRTLDLPVERLATEGPVQNIELMEAGEAKLGFVSIGVALQARGSSRRAVADAFAGHFRDRTDARLVGRETGTACRTSGR